MNIPSKNTGPGWRLFLAARPPNETRDEKVETAQWLIRVVPTVNAREQNEIWDILWAQYRAESTALLTGGYVQRYAPAYCAVCRATGNKVPDAPAEDELDMPLHLLAGLLRRRVDSGSHHVSEPN